MIEDVTMENLEKRMYVFVPYQLTGMQKGIQAGHGVEQYAFKYHKDPEYMDYVKNWRTWYVYDGGTTNSDFDSNWYGGLNQIKDDLKANGIKFAKFKEPDLNNALTAVCFLADERVWNNEKFPDFQLYQGIGGCGVVNNGVVFNINASTSSYTFYNANSKVNADGQTYEEWVEYMGGEKNLFLRELVKNRRFA